MARNVGSKVKFKRHVAGKLQARIKSAKLVVKLKGRRAGQQRLAVLVEQLRLVVVHGGQALRGSGGGRGRRGRPLVVGLEELLLQ